MKSHAYAFLRHDEVYFSYDVLVFGLVMRMEGGVKTTKKEDRSHDT